AAAGLIDPVLVGNQSKIRSVARANALDVGSFEIVDAAHSHDAAAKSAALARSGGVRALMKGSLHSDELLREITRPDSGLHTERRISHAYVMDVPEYSSPLLISDAVVNVAPTLDEKRDIVQNAIDLARALDLGEVRVALLSAIETVNAKIASTIEAAALSKMADRGQLHGANVDGPLALDDALDASAAAEKGIASSVAGRANVLIVPDFESGNVLGKALILLARASAAGIVLGATVPVVLTSRADSVATHVASAAIARLLYQRQLETRVIA
ncbi:MAG TPA: bifunctional enoyl-CoA hydratase/phosphate acetyltransferase, partial [Candidatus Baltobacteraceae bacterium]|nr:bifunctional enoyl-CoA hydratase/phosphate acetyltransferase [Candidatus Baltobacteraceae bacterium]